MPDIASWQHELLRRKFAFDDVGGDVGRFELRCDWKRVVGAKLTLVEYPLAEAQKGIDFKPRLTE
ncbi:MAG: hypothetical protein OEW88_12025 [Gammaproteobacteria bacterium]|nr:hypothetical protein [Gammaproteobacteria bacterium]